MYMLSMVCIQYPIYHHTQRYGMNLLYKQSTQHKPQSRQSEQMDMFQKGMMEHKFRASSMTECSECMLWH